MHLNLYILVTEMKKPAPTFFHVSFKHFMTHPFWTHEMKDLCFSSFIKNLYIIFF